MSLLQTNLQGMHMLFGRRSGFDRAIVVILSLLAVIAVSVGSRPGAAAAEATAGQGCTPMMAFLAPGTWETSKTANPATPKGMMANIGNRLKRDYGSSITVLYTNYSASAFDKGETYAASERDGVERTEALMRRCPGARIILGGYSQGADAAGDVAWKIGHGKGPVPASSVAAVGLIADPKGEKSQALPLKGSGIAGKRPGGYGALADRIQWICDPTDLYCNVTSKNPFLKTLGNTLGSAMNGEIPNVSALTSDYSNVDLAGAVSTADRLKSSAQGLSAPTSPGGAGELAEVATLANQLVATFAPIADTQQWIKQTPGAERRLQSSPKDSPRAQANTVLSTLSGMDVSGIVKSASTIASTLGSTLGSTPTQSAAPAPQGATPAGVESAPVAGAVDGSSTGVSASGSGVIDPNAGLSGAAATGETLGGSITGTASSADLTGLASTALGLASQVAPLGSTDQASLQTASQVLGTVKMDTIVSQGMNVVSAVVGTDYVGIVNNLQLLPQQLFAGDIRGAHRTAGTLNNQFSPWVKMASQIDFKTASRVAGMIPDPQGYAQIASLVLDLVGNVDIVRLARNVGQIQEVAWQILETGNLLALTQLLPIGLDLASVALGVLSPGAKMSPSLLGAGATPEQVSLATSTQGQDVGSLLSSVSGLASSQGATDLSKLIGEGLDAASFLASGSHQSYASKKLAGGRTAIDIIYQFFRQALGG